MKAAKSTMKMPSKTTYLQSLMHMIKCNMSTGILAMPASFAHLGLINAIFGLPILCLMASYGIHLLVLSSKHLEEKMKWDQMEFHELAKGSFKVGPSLVKKWAVTMSRLVDGILITMQLGACCCYLLFVVDNIKTIFWTYKMDIPLNYIFLALLPFVLAICYIRTLKCLSLASACANTILIIGIMIILQYLIRNMPAHGAKISYTRPFSEVALGLGSAMFAFEGIAIALPIYTQLQKPEQMGSLCGIINVSSAVILSLNFLVGLLGYLKFGSESRDSITLNLPEEPLYDVVRAFFAISTYLSYPLQFYVVNKIIWNWAQTKLGESGDKVVNPNYEFVCRTILVLFTFALSASVPRLNLLMDFVGAIGATGIQIIMPSVIHLVTFWEDTSGRTKAIMIMVDGTLIIVGLFLSVNGVFFSIKGIIKTLT